MTLADSVARSSATLASVTRPPMFWLNQIIIWFELVSLHPAALTWHVSKTPSARGRRLNGRTAPGRRAARVRLDYRDHFTLLTAMGPDCIAPVAVSSPSGGWA